MKVVRRGRSAASSLVMSQLCVVLFGVSSGGCLLKFLTGVETQWSVDTAALYSLVMMVWVFFSVALTLATMSVAPHLPRRELGIAIGCCLPGAILLIVAIPCHSECCTRASASGEAGLVEEALVSTITHDLLQIPGYLLLTTGHGIQFRSLAGLRRRGSRMGSESMKSSSNRSGVSMKKS